MTVPARASLAALAAAVLLASAPASAAGAGDSPAVLLRRSLLLTPYETAGTGLAPEVKVRVRVDERGRVAKVDVLSIDPSSEYDDLFRKTTVETLSRWRYAPARKGGEPVATDLEWTIDFRPRKKQSLEAAAHPDRDLRTRVFLRPVKAQVEALDRLAGLAEKHLQPGHRQLAESESFRVVSDTSEPGVAQIVDQDLEAAYLLLDGLFAREVPPQPSRYKVLVYLYSRQESFDSLATTLGRREWFNGLYDPPGLLAFHLEEHWQDTLVSTAVHEAVHAYLDRRVIKPGAYLPWWFQEGLAEYFSNSEVEDGHLVPGRVLTGKYVLDQRYDGVQRETTNAGWSLQAFKEAARRGGKLSVEALVSADPAVYRKTPPVLLYGLSWLFVHFLQHGELGWGDEAFPALVLYLAEGYPGDAALEAAYGKTPAQLERPFRAYVRTF
jgi:hypothetical protein